MEITKEEFVNMICKDKCSYTVNYLTCRYLMSDPHGCVCVETFLRLGGTFKPEKIKITKDQYKLIQSLMIDYSDLNCKQGGLCDKNNQCDCYTCRGDMIKEIFEIGG